MYLKFICKLFKIFYEKQPFPPFKFLHLFFFLPFSQPILSSIMLKKIDDRGYNFFVLRRKFQQVTITKDVCYSHFIDSL